jgi:hypothetical protein
MSMAEATELTDVLNRFETWPTTMWIELAREFRRVSTSAPAPRRQR